jgi:hypothetical protein
MTNHTEPLDAITRLSHAHQHTYVYVLQIKEVKLHVKHKLVLSLPLLQLILCQLEHFVILLSIVNEKYGIKACCNIRSNIGPKGLNLLRNWRAFIYDLFDRYSIDSCVPSRGQCSNALDFNSSGRVHLVRYLHKNVHTDIQKSYTWRIRQM